MNQPTIPPYRQESKPTAQNDAAARGSPADKVFNIDRGEEPEQLLAQLDQLRCASQTPLSLATEADRLFLRTMSVVDQRLPALIGASFPIHRKHRQIARTLQKLLDALVDIVLATLINPETDTLRDPHPPADLTLCRVLRALSRHLLISHLSASPASIGIWHRLHRANALAVRLGVAERTPRGANSSPSSIYHAALLVGCAQPASFNSQEIGFVAEYIELFSDQTEPGQDVSIDSPAAFWVDTTRDAPATAFVRKQPPPEIPIHYFSCERIVELLHNQLDALGSGMTPAQLGLPDFAASPAGLGVMRRLLNQWGEPSKRRFPRRRQNYRASLCVGFGSLWQMFRHDDALEPETSSWMILNESPDGYAVMHVSGKTGPIGVGDVTAIRTETGDNWQICIVRWALSENQEHLELGLQIIATRAVSAFVAGPAETREAGHLTALLLPEIPPLRPTEMLVVPSGTIEVSSNPLFLIVEKDNLEVREIRNAGLSEQNSEIEILCIEPEYSTG